MPKWGNTGWSVQDIGFNANGEKLIAIKRYGQTYGEIQTRTGKSSCEFVSTTPGINNKTLICFDENSCFAEAIKHIKKYTQMSS